MIGTNNTSVHSIMSNSSLLSGVPDASSAGEGTGGQPGKQGAGGGQGNGYQPGRDLHVDVGGYH